MTKPAYAKIPALLDQLVVCSMSEACRRVGISRQTFWNYMVRSAKGDPAFQEIVWNEIAAPLHVHYRNTSAIAAVQIERSAIENARDGFEQDVFFQGKRMFERALKPEYEQYADDLEMLEILVGKDWESTCYHMVPAKQRLKPSDALVIKMLESHMPKRYGSHQTIDVRYGGTLRLNQPPVPKEVEAMPVAFEEVEEDTTEQRGGYLALATPAKTSAEFEARHAAGEFDHAPVEVEAADGTVTTMRPPEPAKPVDPLTRHPRAYDARTGQRPEQPAPHYSDRDVPEGIGRGPDPHRLGKDVGFDVSNGPPRGGPRGVLR